MSGRTREASVQVGGRLRPLRLDNNALCIIEEQTGVNLLDGVDNPQLRVLRALCFAALCSGARKASQPIDFTIDDVGDWMDESPELFRAVKALYLPAMPDPQPVQEGDAARLQA